ncbi:Mitochondrial coenzyme A transporter SLC25A42 [Fragariocoptes setiger]|uniref:[histone H3]-lysine(4) N-trimethyltransferase n=1 Tax=Fragariocoptes setiger TaxID=1670756 RepID=A0ABQ7S7D7_9ACAR|nr:Mitochondrial coenzyme A transporter SLC25A42 [Fragariocoptes setiger]
MILTSLLAGAIAGGVAKTTIAPLDRTKINFQIHEAQFSFKEAVKYLRHTYARYGFTALWRGNSATMVRIIPYAAIQYSSHEQFKKILHVDNNVNKKEHPWRSFLAGSLAGLLSSICTYPLDMARARMAVSKQEQVKLKDIFKVILKNETPSALFRGCLPSMLGIIPYAGTTFFTYETLKRLHFEYSGRNEPHNIERLTFGALAGLLGQSASYPLDVVRRRMQTSPHKLTMRDTIETVLKDRGGVKNFYKGLSLNWIKGPIAVMSIMPQHHPIPPKPKEPLKIPCGSPTKDPSRSIDDPRNVSNRYLKGVRASFVKRGDSPSWDRDKKGPSYLTVPMFMIDDNYVAEPPKLQVSIKNLNDNVDENFLLREIEKFGPICFLKVLHDPVTQSHLGLAKIQFEDVTAASNFVSKYNGKCVMGQTLEVFLDSRFSKINKIRDEKLKPTPKPKLYNPNHNQYTFPFTHNLQGYSTTAGDRSPPRPSLDSRIGFLLSQPNSILAEQCKQTQKSAFMNNYAPPTRISPPRHPEHESPRPCEPNPEKEPPQEVIENKPTPIFRLSEMDNIINETCKEFRQNAIDVLLKKLKKKFQNLAYEGIDQHAERHKQKKSAATTKTQPNAVSRFKELGTILNEWKPSYQGRRITSHQRSLSNPKKITKIYATRERKIDKPDPSELENNVRPEPMKRINRSAAIIEQKPQRKEGKIRRQKPIRTPDRSADSSSDDFFSSISEASADESDDSRSEVSSGPLPSDSLGSSLKSDTISRSHSTFDELPESEHSERKKQIANDTEETHLQSRCDLKTTMQESLPQEYEIAQSMLSLSSNLDVFDDRSIEEKESIIKSFLTEIDDEDYLFMKEIYEERATLEYYSKFKFDDSNVIRATMLTKRKKKPESEGNHPSWWRGCSRCDGFTREQHKQSNTNVWKGDDSTNYEDLTKAPIRSMIQQTKGSSRGDLRGDQRRFAVVHADDFTAETIQRFTSSSIQMRAKSLRFSRSLIHKWGLFACEKISSGQAVVEYVGEKIRPSLADHRERVYANSTSHDGSSYFFRVDLDIVIDATLKGNVARFINHSCNPNCIAKVIRHENGTNSIVIYAKQTIQEDEEITYDYKFPREEIPQDQKIQCNCRAPNCQKYLN